MSLEKILLVDDDPGIRRVAELTLQKIGKFQVLAVDSGHKAVESLRTYRPDLILLDVMMPKLDGPSTLAEIRLLPEFKDIAVLFMTAKVQRQELQSYYNLGIAGVIEKPFDPVLLPKQIRTLLSAHLKANVA